MSLFVSICGATVVLLLCHTVVTVVLQMEGGLLDSSVRVTYTVVTRLLHRC
jgi:hypothetical protein